MICSRSWTAGLRVSLPRCVNTTTLKARMLRHCPLWFPSQDTLPPGLNVDPEAVSGAGSAELC